MNETAAERIVHIMKETGQPAYLATCDGDQPHVRPVTPIIEDDMSVWVATFTSSRKVQQIKKNPRISLSFVEHPHGERAATILGRCEIVTETDQKKRVWGLAAFDLNQFFPEGTKSPEYCLLKVIIEKVEWRENWTSAPQVYEPDR